MQIGVIGSHRNATGKHRKLAYGAGKAIALSGATLVCGGLGGVMEAACRGAKEHGGATVGVLPGRDFSDANRYVDTIIPTGMGHARNPLVVLASQGLIAIGGEAGTLSEMCYAWMYGKPVVSLAGSGGYSEGFAGRRMDSKHKWKIGSSRTPEGAVKKLVALIRKR